MGFVVAFSHMPLYFVLILSPPPSCWMLKKYDYATKRILKAQKQEPVEMTPARSRPNKSQNTCSTAQARYSGSTLRYRGIDFGFPLRLLSPSDQAEGCWHWTLKYLPVSHGDRERAIPKGGGWQKFLDTKSREKQLKSYGKKEQFQLLSGGDSHQTCTLGPWAGRASRCL